MELPEIKKIVKNVISEISTNGGTDGGAQLADDASLIDSGFLDSLGAIQVIEAFSEKFDVIFYPAELSLDHFDTINKISHFIQSKLNGEDA